MKRALLVGIDQYDKFSALGGCVNDVTALHPLLARNEDGSPNLDCRLATAPRSGQGVGRDELLSRLDSLLAPGSDFALFYFAGHGAPQNGDVVLVTSDGTDTTPGVRFTEILELITRSEVKETVVVLDCCFSGGAATIAALGTNQSILPPGTTVLTASRGDQVAKETAGGRGQFSTYFEGALDGGAADVLGSVNISGLYAYLAESFGAWEQRPTLKANIERLHNIRVCNPRVSLPELRKLTQRFPTPEHTFPLDPSYEPTEQPEHPENEAVFAGLQKYRACRLIDPVGEEHLYYAAMNSTGCVLTPLGRHYWHLVQAGRV
ncbi:caspase family protein [Streptomyces agglomeratus]|uniref:caspase family protein n=1 Tax=Streptomyces agglomeratus TaxID=285458 RepID=UPI00085505FA|nr:caspase family protein [Streptomyces agglomeratus]OEJ49515.1 peptidase C14 [Streptomyces agglomeratus]